MTNQEILDNAPEGATHWDSDGYMLASKVVDKFFNNKQEWVSISELHLESETRSLADIKRIVELEKSLQERTEYINKLSTDVQERIAQLEQVADNQVYPSMGDGFSGDYVIGYEKACADISKRLKEKSND